MGLLLREMCLTLLTVVVSFLKVPCSEVFLAYISKETICLVLSFHLEPFHKLIDEFFLFLENNITKMKLQYCLLERTSFSEVYWPLMICFCCHGNGDFSPPPSIICCIAAFYSPPFKSLVSYWQCCASRKSSLLLLICPLEFDGQKAEEKTKHCLI